MQYTLLHRRWLIVALALALVLAVGLRAGPGHATDPAEQAIIGFDPSPHAIDASFKQLNDLGEAQPDALRAAALAHVGASGKEHWAAVYALAITGQPGAADDALKGLLKSSHLDDRALAAGSLVSRGDLAGAPALVELLGSAQHLAYRDPPERAWEFARTLLLIYTGQNFGLSKARTMRASVRTRKRWRAWAQGVAASASSATRTSATPVAAAAAGGGGTSATRSGDTVTITVDIDITPPPVYQDPVTKTSFDHTSQWQAAANKAWNAGFKRFRYHPAVGCPPGHQRDKGYRLKLVVRLHAVAKGGSPTAGHHVVTYNPGIGRSDTWWPPGTRTGGSYFDTDAVYTGTGTGHWNPTRGLLTIIHEVGHLGLGLGDDYKNVPKSDGTATPVALTGRSGTAMADGAKVDQNLVNRVGALAGKQIALPARCNHPKPPKHHPKDLRGLYRHYRGKTDQGEVTTVDIYPDGTLIYTMTVKIQCVDSVTGPYTFLGALSSNGPTGRPVDRRVPLAADLSFRDSFDGAPYGNAQFNTISGRMSDASGHGKATAGDRPGSGRTCTPQDVTWQVDLTRTNP
jgi:hypothetical protein